MSWNLGWNDISIHILYSSNVESTNLFSFIWILNLYKWRNISKKQCLARLFMGMAILNICSRSSRTKYGFRPDEKQNGTQKDWLPWCLQWKLILCGLIWNNIWWMQLQGNSYYVLQYLSIFCWQNIPTCQYKFHLSMTHPISTSIVAKACIVGAKVVGSIPHVAEIIFSHIYFQK